MSGAPTYRIKDIADLLAVPIDRREACVRELLLALALLDLAVGDDGPQPVLPDGIDWTDDGDRSVTATINGDKLTLCVSEVSA